MGAFVSHCLRHKQRIGIVLLGASALVAAMLHIPGQGLADTSRAGSGGVVWSADFETGDTSQWDGVWISGSAESRVVSSIAHSGRYSDALTIYDADGNGSSPGVRMTYQGRDIADKRSPENLPTEAYYSAWYYVPDFVDVSWWNIFQWKTGYDDGSGRTARALYWHDLFDSNGDLYLKLYGRVNSDGAWVKDAAYTLGVASVPIPIGEWFHLESFYKWDADGNGRIVTWLNGEKLWDVGGLKTEFDWDFDVYKREWAINNYANRTNPTSHTIYIDDAVIATTRQGPTPGGTSEATCKGLVGTIVGTPGPDELIGTPGPDVIVGGPGDDLIRGRGGDDIVCGGGGNDRVFGGAGRDVLKGGHGNDWLAGRQANDRLLGGPGSDELFGDRGRDVCVYVSRQDQAFGCEAQIAQ